MGESDVAKAERVGGMRAILYLLMAAVLVLQLLITPATGQHGGRLVLWLATAALFALNLTPFGGWARPRRVTALMNDETTRAHRQRSFAAGFWAALVSALILLVVADHLPMPATLVARVVVTAALAAALLAFGLQERWAAA